ncbi:hypothetical protein MSL71_50790 [Desulfoluna butyratoxydans]|uniref:Uncharacterized protein n=2 Tax=Desulfoluna butyratoxydans TaxID=231438 RepID=A0A4U8YVB0_9BACT|nr:hypothetical protein MSL71_50790 [Desulfoluna butyratoxydans]
MDIQSIELGMELKARNKQSLFVCEKINDEKKTVEGRMIRKGGELGKRIMKETAENILFAQTVLAGFERNAQ